MGFIPVSGLEEVKNRILQTAQCPFSFTMKHTVICFLSFVSLAVVTASAGGCHSAWQSSLLSRY